MRSLKTYLQKAEDFLRAKNVEKPRLEAQLLFSHVLKLQRYELYIHDQKPLEQSEIDQLRELLVKKAAGTPTAYLLGHKDFFGQSFEVNENVLIPRPETEELIEWLLESAETEKTILDLGSGSGCIGTTLALKLAPAEIVFCDISAAALAVCRSNFERLAGHCQVAYIESDLFDRLPAGYLQKFDYIVSNPPYVTAEEYSQLDDSVKKFEPRAALLVENPDSFFRRLFEQARQFLAPAGWLYLETNPALSHAQKELLENLGFAEAEIRNDLSGRPHFIRARKPA